MVFAVGGASWLAVAIGIWLGIRSIDTVGFIRLALVLAAGLAVAVPAFGLSPLWAAPFVGLAVGMAATGVWWAAQPFEKRRIVACFPPPVVRDIAGHELMGAIYPVFVSGSIVAMIAGLTVEWWAGATVVLLLLAVADRRMARARRDVPEGVDPDTVDDLVEAKDELDRVLQTDRLAGTAGIRWPHVLFRGLVGWNLGLGLDAESAAWAAQLAHRHDLGDILSAADVEVGEEAAATLVTCRALAGDDGPVVVELPGDLGPRVVRRMARIIAQHRDGRRVIVVTEDASMGRAFLERVR